MDRVLIEKAITLLHDPEDIVEIRSIDPKPAISGYFKASSQNIYKELARFPEPARSAPNLSERNHVGQ